VSSVPTYDYKCERGHYFEWYQPMNEAPLAKCIMSTTSGQVPADGEDACEAPVVRAIGPGAGVIWKGGPPTRRFGK